MLVKGVNGGLVRVGATSGMLMGRRTSRQGARRDGGFVVAFRTEATCPTLHRPAQEKGRGRRGSLVGFLPLAMLAEMMMNMREGLLAIATGAVAGGFANLFILRRTWLNAQALGDRSDGYVVELRKLHGKYDDVQREPVRAPGREPPAAVGRSLLSSAAAALRGGCANREPATLLTRCAPARSLPRTAYGDAELARHSAAARPVKYVEQLGCGLSRGGEQVAVGEQKGPHGRVLAVVIAQCQSDGITRRVTLKGFYQYNVMFRPKHPWARVLKLKRTRDLTHTSVPSSGGATMPPGTTLNGSRLQGSSGAISGAFWTGLACSTSSSSETSGSSSAAGIASCWAGPGSRSHGMSKRRERGRCAGASPSPLVSSGSDS